MFQGSVGIPQMVPFALEKNKPAGPEGAITHEVTSPPVLVGAKGSKALVSLTVRLRTSVG